MGIIYCCTNLINGKVYIGQTIQSFARRKKSHIVRANAGAVNKFYCSIRKYGKESFTWEILDQADGIETLNKLEKYYIKIYDSFYSGYNMTTGGENKLYSEDIKKKISKANKGRIPWMKGKTHSSESKIKMRLARVGKTGRLNGYSKLTQCIETGQIYESARLASSATGIKYRYIRTACEGRRKTANGYHWQYVER